VLFERHAAELGVAGRLAVLEEAPETAEPSEYVEVLALLLDEALAGAEAEAQAEDEDEDEDEDEAEDETEAGAGAGAVEEGAFRAEGQGAAGARLTRARMVAWFCRRARQIDERSGALDHALALLQLGAEWGLQPELQPSIELAEELMPLVYELGEPVSLLGFDLTLALALTTDPSPDP